MNVVQRCFELGRWSHDVSRPGPTLRGPVDADLAWRPETQSGTVHPVAPAPLQPGGGFGNAILGTVIMGGSASLITVPIGISNSFFDGLEKNSNPLMLKMRAKENWSRKAPKDRHGRL